MEGKYLRRWSQGVDEEAKGVSSLCKHDSVVKIVAQHAQI